MISSIVIGFILESTLDNLSITQAKIENDQTMSTTKAVLILVVIFSASLLTMVYLYYSFPQLKE